MKKQLTGVLVAAGLSLGVAMPALATTPGETAKKCRTEWRSLRGADGRAFANPGECNRYITAEGGEFQHVVKLAVSGSWTHYDDTDWGEMWGYSYLAEASGLTPGGTATFEVTWWVEHSEYGSYSAGPYPTELTVGSDGTVAYGAFGDICRYWDDGRTETTAVTEVTVTDEETGKTAIYTATEEPCDTLPETQP